MTLCWSNSLQKDFAEFVIKSMGVFALNGAAQGLDHSALVYVRKKGPLLSGPFLIR